MYACLVKNQSGENLFIFNQEKIYCRKRLGCAIKSHLKSSGKLSRYSLRKMNTWIIVFFSADNFEEMAALLNVSIEKVIERWNILPHFAITFTLCPRFLISYVLFHRGKSRIISCLIILPTTLSRPYDSRIHAQTRTLANAAGLHIHTWYNRVCRPLSKGSVLSLIAETRDRHVKKVPEGIASPLPFALRLIVSVRVTDHCIIAYYGQPNQFFCLNFN